MGGLTGGYDKLNRLTAFARGTLGEIDEDGFYDSISGTASRTQSWELGA